MLIIGNMKINPSVVFVIVVVSVPFEVFVAIVDCMFVTIPVLVDVVVVIVCFVVTVVVNEVVDVDIVV